MHIINLLQKNETNNLVKQTEKKTFCQKKKVNITRRSISKTFTMKDFFQKEDVTQIKFLEDFGLLIVKHNLLI